MANIARYIENGGALLLTVGPEFAENYSLFGSQLQRLLPAEPSGRVFAGSFRPQLSPIGRRHPVTAGLTNGGAEGQTQSEATWGRWLRHIQVVPEKGNAVMTGQDKRAAAYTRPRRQGSHRPPAQRYDLAVGEGFRRRRTADRADAPHGPLADERT